MHMNLGYESSLVDKFCALNEINSPFSIQAQAIEFPYYSGRIDLIGLDNLGNLYAFEAKLTKWKSALHQAYRATSFCDYSYVLLPEASVVPALKNSFDFQRRRVGLCSIKDNELVIHIKGLRNRSLIPMLTKTAKSFIHNCNETRF